MCCQTGAEALKNKSKLKLARQQLGKPAELRGYWLLMEITTAMLRKTGEAYGSRTGNNRSSLATGVVAPEKTNSQ